MATQVSPRVPRAALRTYRLLWRHGLAPDPMGLAPIRRVRNYVRFWRDWGAYQALPGAERLHLLDSYPQLQDETSTTAVESHYFYQSVWATRLIAHQRPRLHVDVGSDHRWVGVLTSLTRVVFADIRPMAAHVPDLLPLSGNLVCLPFRTDSIESLSCLHVAEHIGLGRYGDLLNPAGTRDAVRELARVLARGGDLYFSLPVGRRRVEFNAHRVHTPTDVLDLFADLKLRSFSVEDDTGAFIEGANPTDYASAAYACGMYWLTKP
jgi:Caenorhabditis protein of unknown function, DUF268